MKQQYWQKILMFANRLFERVVRLTMAMIYPGRKPPKLRGFEAIPVS